MPGNSSPGPTARLHFLRARAHHLRARWNKVARRLQAGPSDEAFRRPIFVAPAILSKLPAEVLFLILDKISLPEKVALAQTCRDFQHIISKVSYHDDSDLRQRHKPGISMREFLTPDEQLEYLCHATRLRPDSWACHLCVAAHGGASFEDTSGTKTARNQMDHPCRRLRAFGEGHVRRLGPSCSILPVKHHQAQLLFKYIRRWETIDESRQQYAKDVSSSFTYDLPAEDSTIQGTCSVQPKMIMTRNKDSGCLEPRLLVKSVRTYKASQNPETISSFQGCPHDVFTGGRGRFQENLQRKGTYQFKPMVEMVSQAVGSTDGREVFAACEMCSSDFSARIDGEGRCIITKWQDLGHEASSETLWRAQTDMNLAEILDMSAEDIFTLVPTDGKQVTPRKSHVWYYHDPGSLIQDYEQPGMVLPWMTPEDAREESVRHVVDPETIILIRRPNNNLRAVRNRFARAWGSRLREVGYPDHMRSDWKLPWEREAV